MERFEIQITQAAYGTFQVHFCRIEGDHTKRFRFGFVEWKPDGYMARDERNTKQGYGATAEEAVEHLLSSMIVKRDQ